MRKVTLLAMLVALGVIAWAIPATPVQASTHNAVLTAQQEEAPAETAEEAEAQVFTGKIVQQEGKFVLQEEGGKTYQLDDQEKAKGFEGKDVKVTGTLDEQNGTIHVSEIEEAEE